MTKLNLKAITAKLTIEEQAYLNGRLSSLRKESSQLKSKIDSLERALLKSKTRIEIDDTSAWKTEVFFNPLTGESKKIRTVKLYDIQQNEKSKAFQEAIKIILKSLYSSDFDKKSKTMELDSEGNPTNVQSRDSNGNLLFHESQREQLDKYIQLLLNPDKE